ncbi:MAG: DUF1007 family protein [Geminicoccaceae bacterium]
MRTALAGLGLALLAASPAAAHPHVWIDARVDLQFAQGRLDAIAMRWTFDDLFSDFVLNEYDRNGDGLFDAEETKAVEHDAFEALGDVAWLTRLWSGETMIQPKGYRDLAITAADRIVTYSFTLELPEPVDPLAAPLVLGVYDETYYIDVLLAEQDPVKLSGEPPPGCRFQVFEDTAHPIYFGTVAPQSVDLTCASS